ncbi:MAG TPA: phosphoglycolate phosphatase [Allosphingosinicella sp.]|jgi:phosphoglycolate phosphatase
MADFPFDTIAFDLDGTLADTAPDLAAALNHALAMLGRRPIEPDSVRYLVGHGARALLRRGLAVTGEASEELVERGFPHFIHFYAAHICVRTRAYPGVEAALEALDAEGVRLALCTNKPEMLTVKLLAALGWEGRFGGIVAGDTLPLRKPDPAPLFEAIDRAGGGRAAFIGDSIIDAETARAARLPFVAVSFGFSDRPVTEFGATAIINSFDALVPTLLQL